MQPEAGLIADHLRKLETDLLQPAIRKSLEALLLLLAEDFCEFGSSGLVYTRQEAIDGLSAESPVRFSVTDFAATLLAPGVALVRYRAARRDDSAGEPLLSLRSSVWILRDDRWQMLFHQGTKVAAENVNAR